MKKITKAARKKAAGIRIYYLLLAFPVLAFLWLIIKYSTNAPLADDFYTVLAFLNNFTPAGASEKISLLFAQHNEHRLVFSRLLTLAVDRLLGGIDFRILIFFGGLMIFLLVYALFLSFKEKNEKLKYFLPVLFIILQPQYSGSIFWATSVLQNAGVLAFSMFCLYFLARKNAMSIFWAMAFALAAVFTAANGLLLLAVGALLFFTDDRKKEGILWLCFSAIVLITYFYGYSLPAHAAKYYSVANIFGNLIFFLVLLGSALLINFGVILEALGPASAIIVPAVTALFGAAMVARVIVLAKNKYHKKNPAVFYFMIILLVTALAAAFTRSGAGIFQAITSRYRIISVLMLALLYISYIEQAAKKQKSRLYNVFLSIAVVFCLISYMLNMYEIKVCKSNLETGIGTWIKEGKGLELLNEPVKESDEILRKAIQEGHYHLSGIPINEQ